MRDRPVALNQIPPCPGGTLYTIRPGDSFFGLARRFNTSVMALLAANPQADPQNLQLGQVVCIPVAPPPGPCPGGFPYIIRTGDTFFSIARRFGIAVPALAAANPGVDPDALQVGQRICVPAPPPPVEECPGGFYTIRPGDTFFGLARRFGYTIDALLAVNPGVDPENLQIGQQICLPPSPGGGPLPCFGGSMYVVRPGETRASLARRFGVALADLLRSNPQIEDPNVIQAGEPICIPR
ncbi:MAG: LysM peptidoglycan-binding domain-containing protein [Firmicutes bacterium]|nr:LysM peptidoglycan-binding domain-containing protein [Bacillota bacterium]